MMPMPAPNPQPWGSPHGNPVATPISPLDEIRALAFQTFGTPQAVDFWMIRPNPELSGQSPEDLINAGRAQVVKEFLESLLAGDFG
jgi:uncharacterized protein (DUF2384 family)